jgi:hypothetical protein
MEGGNVANQSKALMKPVKYNGERMSALEAWKCIDALPPDFPLTTDEAALFLRRSISTMERMRRERSGPVYVQAGGADSKGTNQKVVYYKQALEEWNKANTVSNSMQAAIRKGQAFATIFDLADGLPFYIDPDGAVESMAEDNPIDLVVERLGGWNLMWLTPVEASTRRWSSLSAHKDFGRRVQDALTTMQAGIEQAYSDTELAESLGD